ncbi:hypothetical protein, partial [Paraburkholderia humisilvae]|uniref:hypothetical protein n=1 Tax=Paraburkholderia humisilvae TaxID=627669 RepID=UPI0035E9EAA2
VDNPRRNRRIHTWLKPTAVPSVEPGHSHIADLVQSILRRSSTPVSKAGFIEHRLEDRFQPVEQRLLAYPIINSFHT